MLQFQQHLYYIPNKCLFEQDLTKKKITYKEINNIIMILGLVLNNFFQLNGRIYEQTEGLRMGSPIFPLLAQIYIMDHFEQQIYKNISQELPNKIQLWINM